MHNGEDDDLQIGIRMTEIQHDDLGYVYGASPNDLIELTDNNWIHTVIGYNVGGSPFRDAEFIIRFQFDTNLDTIASNESYTQGGGYSLELPSGGTFTIMYNQTLLPSFIEDTYFEPQEERYIMILTV